MPETATQPPLALNAYNNQSLFSDHYRHNILRREPAWQTAVTHARPSLTWLKTHYQTEKEQIPHYNESQLEDHWFKPILEQLGHAHWKGQPTIPGWQGSVKKPDFVIFTDSAARAAPGVARLSRRLAATNDLIDKIVYQLYGLTDEEIRLVQSKGE